MRQERKNTGYRAFIAATCLLFLTLSGDASADVFTVGAGGDYTDLPSAVAAANANPGEDILELLDTYYETGDFIPINESIIIRPHTNQTGTITIEKTSGVGQVLRLTSVNNSNDDMPFNARATVTGNSPENPIVIRNAATALPIINTGAVTGGRQNWVLINVVLERPTTGNGSTGNAFALFNNSANADQPHILDNVVFRGGDPDAASGTDTVLRPGSAMTNEICHVIVTNCDFSQVAAPFTRIGINDGGSVDVTVNDSIITEATGASAPGIRFWGTNTPRPEISLWDCELGSGNTRFLAIGAGNSLATVRFVRPVFVSGLGDVAFAVDNHSRLEFWGSDDEGSPLLGGEKSDFTPMMTGGTVQPFRTKGDLILVDMRMEQKGGTTTFMDSAFIGPMTQHAELRIVRCEFLDGSGVFNLIPMEDGQPAPSEFAYAVLVENSVFTGETGQGAVLAFQQTTANVPEAITGDPAPGQVYLRHSTFNQATANIAIDITNATYRIFADGTIIDTSNTASRAANGTDPLWQGPQNVPNILFSAGGSGSIFPDPGVYQPWLPGGSAVNNAIVANPLLEADGSLINPDSPAHGAAVDSTLALDIVGNTRPQPAGTANDIGAYESDVAPMLGLSLSGPQIAGLGSTVTFVANINNAIGNVTISWSKDGQILPGEEFPTLILTDVQDDDAGVYKVTVNADNGTEEATITLQITGELPLTSTMGLVMVMTALGASGFAVMRRRRS